MHDLTNAVWIELRKATRSRMPLFTALGFLVLPCGLAFFMFIYKYPTFARNIGLLAQKPTWQEGLPPGRTIWVSSVRRSRLAGLRCLASWRVGCLAANLSMEPSRICLLCRLRGRIFSWRNFLSWHSGLFS